MQVTPEVRARVQHAVEQLGYRPNVMVCNLADRILTTRPYWLFLGALAPELLQPDFEEFEQSIVEAAEEQGYHILLFPARGNRMSGTYQKLLYSGRVDGFILSDSSASVTSYPALQHLNVPLVAFGGTQCRDDCAFAYVDIDGGAGVRLAVEHLLAQGASADCGARLARASRVGSDCLSGYWAAMGNSRYPHRFGWCEVAVRAKYEGTVTSRRSTCSTCRPAAARRPL